VVEVLEVAVVVVEEEERERESDDDELLFCCFCCVIAFWDSSSSSSSSSSSARQARIYGEELRARISKEEVAAWFGADDFSVFYIFAFQKTDTKTHQRRRI
jgi:hypothetical protein